MSTWCALGFARSVSGSPAGRNGRWMSSATSTETSTGPQHTRLHGNARCHTGESANPLLRGTVAHANARCCTVSVRLITRSSEDELLDYDGSARILPCNAWEGSWEKRPTRPKKYAVTW